MFFESNWFLIIGAVLFLIASAFDIVGSIDFPYYGVTEKTPTMSNKYGYMDLTKALIGTVAVLVLGILLGIFLSPAIGFMFYLLAFYRFYLAFKNAGLKKKNRAIQISFLKRLRELLEMNADSDTILTHFGSLRLVKKADHFSFPLFGWLFSTQTAEFEAYSDLMDKIKTVSMKPESQWFPK